MDVKQITERLNRGVVYEGMAQDLENLLTSGDITQAEYDALSKKIGEITSSFKEVVIEEAKGESNEIEVSELTSEEPEGKVLEDLFATNPTATGASEDKDAAGSDSADESKEENEENVKFFLSVKDGFRLLNCEEFNGIIKRNSFGSLIVPSDFGSDGFYFAVLEKVK